MLMPVLLWGCPPVSPMPDSGEEEEEVPYEGETVSGVIPELPPEERLVTPVDAGTFSIETRCCNLRFSIADEEAADVTGTVVGSFAPLDAEGLDLVRDGGTWSAAACFPLGASTAYAYHFRQWVPFDGGSESDAGEADGGLDGGDAGDGGSWVVSARYSQSEPYFSDGLGNSVNYIPAVSDCAVLDASVGMLP